MAGERVEQITVDHSHVQELVDSGELSPEDARVHGERNIVTRALGAGMPGVPRVDQWLLMVEPGERLMICTDGLSGRGEPGQCDRCRGGGRGAQPVGRYPGARR